MTSSTRTKPIRARHPIPGERAKGKPRAFVQHHENETALAKHRPYRRVKNRAARASRRRNRRTP